MLFVFTVLMCGQQSCLSNSSQILWTSTSMTRFDDFLDFGQQLICPSLPHSSAIFVKLSKSFIFLVKPFLVNFYRQYAIFSCPTDLNPCYIQFGEATVAQPLPKTTFFWTSLASFHNGSRIRTRGRSARALPLYHGAKVSSCSYEK